MVFSSPIFLFFFLPLALFCYFFSPWRLKNVVLLLFSLVFYAWGEPMYVFLMLFSILMNYVYGIYIEKYFEQTRKKKAILFIAIVSNTALLGYYKYINFFVDLVNQLFHTAYHVKSVPLPIGISFYTFHAMSYVVDVYRSRNSQKNLFNLALYITLFPQLVAGPIIRYHIIEHQLRERKLRLDQFADGIRVFIIGLAKKVLIANQMGIIADKIFTQPTDNMSTLLAWVGILAYTLQIYFDFSGYSQMAIGLGKMFGFEFPINFNFPYISRSVSEFWRRWHMTLGQWFRDYVYIPLGGGRVATWKVYRNLFIVWMLTGFWHGASWTFIAWGLYYGILISLEKAGLEKILAKCWMPVQHLYVLMIVMIGWVFFRADNFPYAASYIQAMFGLRSGPLVDEQGLFYIIQYSPYFIAAIIGSMPFFDWIKAKLVSYKGAVYGVVSYVFYFGLFFETIFYLVTSTYNPFIYFRF
ncbi:MBOAT family O-acyltransferase [Aneurinibacillus soli]|uniref:MBOAT family O-acyltransferase n=1 Tax=Aneurinibacillus soli TaxID=1500254 RepID=UPI000BBA95A5|nr:MBOAT family O-acyltransferase [Aneurinibacillus soli]